MDHEIEYNEYLFKNMKSNITITTSTTTTSTISNNNKKKKKNIFSKQRGIGSKRRGLNLRVKLKRFWVRVTIANWFNLRLRCLSRALESLLFNIRSTRRNKTSNSSTTNTSSSTNNHYQCSYVRSNSFYAEAIADCLEFIKRSSSNHHHHHHDQYQSHKLLK